MARNEVTAKPKGAGQYLTLIIVLLVGIAGMAGVGFYQEEVFGFFRMQIWNPGPLKDGTQQFLKAAADNDGEKVTSMLALDPGIAKEIRENGKLVGFELPIRLDTVKPKLPEFATPEGTNISGPNWAFVDGGSAQMEIKYPKDKTVILIWKQKEGAWKIAQVVWNPA